jgi:hypothetical protein
MLGAAERGGLVSWRHVDDAGCPKPSAHRGPVGQTLAGLAARSWTPARSFWWMDWNRMIRDAITAMRTGEPVLYDDDEWRCAICLKA